MAGSWRCRSCGSKRALDRGLTEHSRLSPEEKRKANARAYANVYKRRGKIPVRSCRTCRRIDAEMHHPDYSKPLDVDWLCRRHHLEHHKSLKK